MTNEPALNVDVRDMNGLIRVRFSYDLDAIAIIKKVPGATWNANIKAWVIPSSEAEAAAVAVAEIEPILIARVAAEKEIEKELDDAARNRSVKMPPPSTTAMAAARKRAAARRGK